MSKKKEPVKISKAQAADLAVLIARMQKNADQVEKNILQLEKLLNLDSENDTKRQPLLYKRENGVNLSEAETLLKNLFMDVDKAKRLNHPQSDEIEKDVRNLHDRWAKDCSTYRILYDQVKDIAVNSKIDWASLLDEKQKQIKAAEYGPNLSDLEKQIAAHNILHREIESYNAQLVPSNTPKEQYAVLKDKYAKLLESSELRRKHLASLYEYMQSCSKELVYLSDQQARILHRDWSDLMDDPPGVRMEYEKFKNNGLLFHESETNQLQEEGDKLIGTKHPGSATIKAHQDAVQGEWQSFLNLCIAQETHLDNIELYRKFQLDAETLAESVTRLKSTQDPKFLANKSNPEVLLALEGDGPSIERNEQRLAALSELSCSIAPLKQRRLKPIKPTSVLALCLWQDEEDTVRRGDKLTLKSNSDNVNWEVQTSSGKLKTLPGACFMVPPPDEEAIDKVNSLGKELTEIKKRRAALMASMRTPNVEVIRSQTVAAVASAPEDHRAAELACQLDKIIEGLDKSEKEILGRLRTPLDRQDPTQDLANRLKNHEKTILAVRNLEAEKSAVQRDMEPILAKKPLGPIALTLPVKLNAANIKIDDLNTLSDLYNKKATASMFLEKQKQKVDGIVSGFEEKLVNDVSIPDSPNALQARHQELQALRKNVASQQDEIHKLGRDLELTEQVCDSIQKGFSEYCPDIRNQESEVKHLKNRYTNVSNQLQMRSTLIQETNMKNQGFQNAAQSLNSFLLNLPNNKVNPTDSLDQITSKQNSQQRVVQDIQRKSDDISIVKDLSHDLQDVLNDYEANSNKYRVTLNYDEDESVPKRSHTWSMSDAVQKKERDLLNLYSVVSAENEQLLSQMGVAKNIMAKNEEKVSQVVVKQQLQLQSQQQNMVQTDGLKKDLNDEIARRSYAENDLETYRKRLISLKSRRGVERVEEKEVVQYYRDPKLEVELTSLKNRIKDETMKRTSSQSEINIMNEKIVKLQTEMIRVEPKLVTKVFTEYERDPQLEKEATRIRDEIRKIRQELQTRNTETVQMKTEITVLAQQKPNIKETVVKKEVVRLEKDPEMLKSVLVLQTHIAEEGSCCQSLNDEIFSTRSQINSLERVIPTIQPKIVTKVVKKVEQDPEVVQEAKKLSLSLEEEKDENAILSKGLSNLMLHYSEIEKIKPKVEVKEIVNEIYRVDPETEVEIIRLKKELQDCSRNRTAMEKEMDTVMVTLTSLRSQKPQVEYKEVTQEVIKEEKSPEVIRELQRLNNQVSRLQVNCDTTLELLARLRKERDELKAEKSKVETKLVTKELIKYENDPLLEKEADRLRRNVREEIQQRRNIEETVFDLQNKYILLERQKPEEKIVVQEVLRLEKDPKQMLEHEKLNRTLDEEVKARRKLELEVRHLRAMIEEKEKLLSEIDDRQKKIQVEMELRQIKTRILELESAPPPIEEKIIIEEVLKVERDPKLEKLTGNLRANMEDESNNISRLEREICNLRIKLEILQKEKSIERIVYKDVVRVAKDPAVEAERDHLRELLMQEKNLRRDQEDKMENLNTKIIRLQTSRSATSQDETSLTLSRDALQKEKDNLLRELKMLESERQNISITFHQQSKMMSERNQISRQKSLKMQSDVQRWERDILEEKEKIRQKEVLISELMKNMKKEDHSETHTIEKNLSTKITILDPETGKDMSPYDAYLQGLIDRKQYIHLAELECDWEEISTMGPDGESSILQDRKSGKQFSIKKALEDGRLTQYELQRYKDGKMPISEFALLVAGEIKKPTNIPMVTPKSPTRAIPSSSLNSMPSSLRSSFPSLNTYNSSSYNSNSYNSNSYNTNIKSYNSNLNSYRSLSMSSLSSVADEFYPISGVFDTTTQSRMSVRSALTRKLIDSDTALKLLEAQAATGGIIDLNKKDKLSVHKAAEHGLIDTGHLHKLLNAQKAFTGVEDPVTKVRLSVGQAAEKGWIPEDCARRYMLAQHLTGGLVDPAKAGRLSIQEALAAKMIDSAIAKDLQDESSYVKELVDPITKAKISYKQAIGRCRKDTTTGLLLLPAASTDAANAPSYSNYRFSQV